MQNVTIFVPGKEDEVELTDITKIVFNTWRDDYTFWEENQICAIFQRDKIAGWVVDTSDESAIHIKFEVSQDQP